MSLILIADRHGHSDYWVRIYHHDRPVWDGIITGPHTLKSLIGKIYRAIRKEKRIAPDRARSA